MASVRFFAEVKGGAALRAALRRRGAEALPAIGDALEAEAQVVRTSADSLAPRASGELAASVEVRRRDARTRTQAKVLYTDAKAAAVHEGLHGNRRVPGTKGYRWLRRAWDAAVPGLVERVAQALREWLARG